MRVSMIALIFLGIGPSTWLSCLGQEIPQGVGTAKSNSAIIAVDFEGTRSRKGGGGTILSPLGVAAAHKAVVGGTTDGSLQIASGEQFDIIRVFESDVDLAFVITSRLIESKVVNIRSSVSVKEGEEIVCRAPIGGSQLMGTARGFISHARSPGMVGTIGVQLPLTGGCSGVGIFDLKGSLIGVSIGQFSKAPGFHSAWSGDVIRAKIIDCFATSWEEFLPELELKELSISNDNKYGLRKGDKVKAINGAEIASMTDWLLAGGALFARMEERVEFIVDRAGVDQKILVNRQK